MDILKFKCKSCGKKMGVRAEHAGKRVKCQGCGEPIRVPTPRPDRSKTGVPVAAGSQAGVEAADPGESSGSRSGSLDDLYALAAMEQSAQAEVAALDATGARQFSGTASENVANPCPACGAGVAEGAVICINCGYNFKSNKRLKTKQSKEGNISAKGAAAGAGKAALALTIAGVVAVVFAVIWIGIALVTQRQFGFVAWIMGGAIGFVTALISRRQSVGVGIAAAAISLATWAVVKGVMLAGVLALGGLSGMVDGYLTMPAVADQMYAQQAFTPELAEYHEHFLADTEVDHYGEDEDWRLYEQYEEAVFDYTNAMSQAEIDAAVSAYNAANPDTPIETLSEELGGGIDVAFAFFAVFGLFDILWVILMVSTAYKVGSHGQL